MLKTCPACEHPEKNALEDALVRGEPYQALTKQFRVFIGAMRRHREGHMSGEQARNGEANQASQDALPCFLKFGDLPEGGFSYNGKFDMYEDGVAVFRGKRTRSGYVFDLPGGQDKEDEEDAFPPLGACVVLFSYIVAGRVIYEASGTELDEPGFLEIRSSAPIAPYSSPYHISPESACPSGLARRQRS